MKVAASLLVLAAALSATAFETRKPAKQEIDGAVAKAAKSKKNVYIMFTASWCGYCKLHKKFMDENKEFYAKNFEYIEIYVNESPELKNSETPGGADYLKKWKGEKSGIPYLVMLNSKGEVLGNSLAKQDDGASNIGHPMTDAEIETYMKLLTKAAPNASKSDLDGIKAKLMAQDR